MFRLYFSTYRSSMSDFSSLGLEPNIQQGVESMGFTTPTSIQAQAIPLILAGEDVIGASQTGTGKTAAFGLPVLSKLKSHGKLRCLILEPTRELAAQVDVHLRELGKFTDLSVLLIHGGVGFGYQHDGIKDGCDIIVATPGRLLDLMSRGTLKLDDLEIVILDETDRMLDMGFLPDVRKILRKCPDQRQTLLFSATMPAEIQGLASWALQNPKEIAIGGRRSVAETVSHAFYPVADSQRDELLLALLAATDFHSVMIFTRTKRDADRLVDTVKKHGSHPVTVMHADLNQSQRVDALNGFREGRYSVIIATDIAARGLDIGGVTHVINFSVPENAEDYVHRIGRTGRAEKEGDAFTILTAAEVPYAEAVERYLGKTIERRKLDDFPYVYTALLDETAGADRERLRRMLGKRPKPRRRK
jgi:ATP-dependent RNA helicase RhlE